MGKCAFITDVLSCTPETNTLQINYTPIKIKSKKKVKF